MIVGNREFKTCKELESYARALVNSMPLSEFVDISSELGKDIHNLLRRHPDPKKLQGALGFRLVRSEVFKSQKVLTIEKSGDMGKRIDVSWLICCKKAPKATSARYNNIYSMRLAVNDQVAAHRIDGYEVHHEEAFKTLVDKFCADNGIDLEVDHTTEPEGFSEFSVLREDIRVKWCDFHRVHAKLVVLTKEEHKKSHFPLDNNSLQAQ